MSILKMNGHKSKVFITFILTFFANSLVEAQVQVPTTSTSVAPPATQARMKCPALHFNDQPALTSNSVTVNLSSGATGPATQFLSDSSWAWIGIFGVMGAHFYPQCPTDFPYMCGITEQGGGMMLLNTTVMMSVTCCAQPNPPVRLINDVTTWANAPDCP